MLRAMTMGTLAALAWLMASSVCGRTPSSQATTMMAMSVTLVPRARMALNACTRRNIPQPQQCGVKSMAHASARRWIPLVGQ